MICTSSGCITSCKNLLSQDLLVLLKCQKSWNLFGWNQKFATFKTVQSHQKILSIFISWDNRISKLLQSDWPRVFQAITQNGELGIKNYIFCSRLLLKNSKDKTFSENLGNPVLAPFCSEYQQKLIFPKNYSPVPS